MLRARVVTCVRVVALIFCLVCVAHPILTSVLLCEHLCKGERLQVVEIPRKRDIVNKAKHRGIQVGLWTA